MQRLVRELLRSNVFLFWRSNPLHLFHQVKRHSCEHEVLYNCIQMLSAPCEFSILALHFAKPALYSLNAWLLARLILPYQILFLTFVFGPLPAFLVYQTVKHIYIKIRRYNETLDRLLEEKNDLEICTFCRECRVIIQYKTLPGCCDISHG